MINLRGVVVRACGIFRIVKVSEPFFSLIDNNPRSPKISTAVKSDTLKTAGTVAAWLSVPIVLGSGTQAQVVLPIVKRVEIPMVIKSAHTVNRLWHRLFSSNIATGPAEGVEASGARIPSGVPGRSEAFKILRIDNGILSERQGNQPVIRSNGLSDFVTWFRSPCHKPSLAGRFVAHFITGGALSGG